VLAAPGPPDHGRASAHWQAIFGTLTGRGFGEPPFLHLVWGPTVLLDPTSATPMPEQLKDATVAALAVETLKQRSS